MSTAKKKTRSSQYVSTAPSRRRAKPTTENDDSGVNDLDAFIASRATKNADFPALVEAAVRRRALLRALAQRRDDLGLTQREVAARMGTSQAAVDRLEGGNANAQIGTLERFAAALGACIDWEIRTVD